MRRKIMLVDDDRDFLEEMKEVLVLSDYEVFTAGDPASALTGAIQAKPDVVIMDLKMPGESGLQLAGKFKLSEALKKIPIILMSAYLDEVNKSFLQDNGICGFLKKPFTELDVITKIEAAL